jgi:non-ribosomal peptide synthetase component E (peptide arylation enzyme)
MTDLGPALTLGQMVDRAAARFPDRIAVVFKRERISYADLKRRADDFARGLLALGLGPGDHVVLWMPNRVEWNVANLGGAGPDHGGGGDGLRDPEGGRDARGGGDRHLRAGRIANFKVPKYVEIVDRFPLTGSGKVQKFKQKAYAVEKYALRGP